MSMAIMNAMKPGVKYTRDELLKLNPNPDYDGFRKSKDPEVVEQEVRTKQSFRDSSDVNKIIKKHSINVAQSHLMQFPEEFYGQFEGFDLLEAHQKINKIGEAFDALPSEVRNEFGNNPFAFAGFVTDPANQGKLAELLPKLAEPAKYFPNPASRGGQGAGAATAPKGASAPEGASPGVSEGDPQPSGENAANAASGASGGDSASSST